MCLVCGMGVLHELSGGKLKKMVTVYLASTRDCALKDRHCNSEDIWTASVRGGFWAPAPKEEALSLAYERRLDLNSQKSFFVLAIESGERLVLSHWESPGYHIQKVGGTALRHWEMEALCLPSKRMEIKLSLRNGLFANNLRKGRMLDTAAVRSIKHCFRRGKVWF